MNELIEGIRLAVTTVVLFLLFAAILLGFSCSRHGDVGPYPEERYTSFLVVPAFLVACWLWKGKK